MAEIFATFGIWVIGALTFCMFFGAAVCVGLILFWGFNYLKVRNLKKIYMVVLIIILVINFVLALKYMMPAEPALLEFGLLFTQLITIPLIAWHRPDKDFEEIKEEEKRKEEVKQSVHNANSEKIREMMKEHIKNYNRKKF